jgi:predicted component of type VI protein secretion system
MEAILNGPSGRITLGPGSLAIGRAADNQLLLNDAKASSHHAEIRPEGQGYSIVDLGSTNGTFVNEQYIERNQPRLLNSGDTIRIGDTRFTYEVSGAYNVPPTIYAEPMPGAGSAYQPTIAAPSPNSFYGSSAQQGYQGGYQQVPPSPYDQPAQPFYNAPPPPPTYAPPPMGQPGIPVYAPPMQPAPKKSRRGLWITLGVIGAVLVLLCIAFSVLVVANLPTPAKTLDAFCNALTSGDNHTAYTQFSSNFQRQVSEPAFTQVVSQDKITTCAHGTPNESGNSAKTTLKLVHKSTITNNDVVTLIKDSNGDWKIDNLQQQ